MDVPLTRPNMIEALGTIRAAVLVGRNQAAAELLETLIRFLVEDEVLDEKQQLVETCFPHFTNQ